MKLLMSLPFVRRFLTLRALSTPLSSFAKQDWAAREELELELEIGLKDHGPEAEGYHPVTIGDVLGSHYRIIKKLGWGVYSTVACLSSLRQSFSDMSSLGTLTLCD